MRQEEAEDCGRLLAYALMRARVDAAHRDLLQRLRIDGGFRSVFEAFCRGLGLRLLDITEQGAILAADSGSPFAFRMSDYRQNLSVEDRLAHGLLHVAIAAWCFPTAASLEDEDRAVLSITEQEIVGYVRRLCLDLQRRAAVDPDAARPELQEAWSVLLSRAETRDTGDGRRAAHTLSGMVSSALERLAEEGLFRRDGAKWLLRPAWRVQVRDLAALGLFRLVQQLPASEEGRVR